MWHASTRSQPISSIGLRRYWRMRQSVRAPSSVEVCSGLTVICKASADLSSGDYEPGTAASLPGRSQSPAHWPKAAALIGSREAPLSRVAVPWSRLLMVTPASFPGAETLRRCSDIIGSDDGDRCLGLSTSVSAQTQWSALQVFQQLGERRPPAGAAPQQVDERLKR
jgi:hypothetical protein